MLLLWRGLQRRDARLSASRMDFGDIQRGRGARFRVGGTVSKVLMIWNFTSNLLIYLAGGSLIGNDLLTWR